MEFLKAQLKQQRLLNEAIANERAGLRDVIVDASKVARDLSSTLGENQDNALIGKVEVLNSFLYLYVENKMLFFFYFKIFWFYILLL